MAQGIDLKQEIERKKEQIAGLESLLPRLITQIGHFGTAIETSWNSETEPTMRQLQNCLLIMTGLMICAVGVILAMVR